MTARQGHVSTMIKTSAGILLFRTEADGLRVMLAHPGGPFWQRRDHGAWTIPKGEFEPPECPEDAARREFAEETGQSVTGPLIALGEVRQPSGKRLTAFAVNQDFDVTTLRSNPFILEWPPRSGRYPAFPELDRAEWFPLKEARQHILPGQLPFLDRLCDLLGVHDESC